MRSNLRGVLASLICVLALGTGCGKIGEVLGFEEKKPGDSVLHPGNDIGCYDQLGPKVRRFFNGDIEKDEWLTTFKCVDDQIDFFQKYVRGGLPDGYDRSDIGVLIRRFLIVSRPVSDSFVASIFDLKASVFGGRHEVITHGDLDEFKRLNGVLREQSLKLLPHLRARRSNPSGENLIKLADAIAKFGEALSVYVGGLRGNLDVTKESYIPFARELLTLNGGDAAVIDRYADFVRNLKVIIAGGSPDIIEKNAWSTIVKEGALFGGLLFAYRDMEEEFFAASEDQDQFMLDLSDRAHQALKRVIARHGVGIPLELFVPVIDTLPWDGLDAVKRAAIKHDMRQIVFRGLQSKLEGWLTPRAVANAVSLYQTGMRAQIHLKRIYRSLETEPSYEDFEVAARRYLSRISDSRVRAEVSDLIKIGRTFVGLFPEGASQIVFTNAMREARSRNHMIRMAWIRKSINYLFGVYSPGSSTAARKAARTEDLEELVKDILEILKAWKLAKPSLTAKEMATKRFREANLFMPSSDGNRVLDETEGTYYVAFLLSSSALSNSVFDTIVDDWKACVANLVDEIGKPAMTAECFRTNYFGRTDVFWSNFPGLQVAYAKMSENERKELQYSMEQAARTGGRTEKPIGPYDIDSLAALPHYVEDIMESFDANDDEILDRREVLDRAYPIFKQTLSDVAKSKSDFILRGVLTYLIYHGELPPDNAAEFLLWCARVPFVKIEADRNDLYRIVALLSTPTTPAAPLKK